MLAAQSFLLYMLKLAVTVVPLLVALNVTSGAEKTNACPSKSPVPVTMVVFVAVVFVAVVLVAAWRSLVAAGKTGFSIWK